MTKKKKLRIALWASAVAVAAVIIIVMLSVIPAQRAKLRELEAEKNRLNDQLNELLLKHEGLEELLEYTGSAEFLLRYARENLGFMLEGDIRVDVDDPNAAVTTLSPARPTDAQASESPDAAAPTDEPADGGTERPQ